MKTKEQKRQEANQRKLTQMQKIVEIGGEAWLKQRLENLSTRPGECKRERKNLEKALLKLQEAENKKTMSVKELKQESKKSKVGK